MILPEDEKVILALAREYQVRALYLFGSALTSDNPRDYDLAVEGLESSKFFEFYGKLFGGVSKPVDLVDLDAKQHFNYLIEDEMKRIYEAA